MTPEERIAALEAKVLILAQSTKDLSDLLRDHMLREEETTRELLDGLASLDRRMAKWHGIAVGAGIVVSALWALLGLFITLRI